MFAIIEKKLATTKLGRFKHLLVPFLFLCIYLLLFSSLSKGIGYYWDWSLPQFRDHLRNVAVNYSWQDAGLGDPIGYVSNFYFGHLLSLGYYLKVSPEIIIYLLIVVSATLSSYFAYLILRKNSNSYLAWLCSLAVVINPAYYYKLLAGHFSYLVALSIFIFFIYFLFEKFDKSLRSYVIIALLLSFAMIQIQFFIFCSILLIVYMIFHREKFSIKGILLTAAITFLTCLPWLSNFIVGADAVSGASQSATQMLFDGSSHTSLPRIFAMAFSVATNIQYIYKKIFIGYFLIFTASVYLSVICYYAITAGWPLKIRDIFVLFGNSDRAKEEGVGRKMIGVLFVSLVAFTLLGTGFYQGIPIPVLKTFYPILRESGHLAPIIVLFSLLLFGRTSAYLFGNRQNKIGRILLLLSCSYLVLFISINAFYFVRYLPKVNFAETRAKFQPFEDFSKENEGTNRILTYPFWNQYSLQGTADTLINGKLLNNSGYDTFIENSGQSHINNYAPGGQSIDSTLQYRLMKTYDITELREKNVKYIYDFSNIYTSNFEKYTSVATYNNDLSLIKNDPQFIEKLIAANPDQIRKVAENIYEIVNPSPLISLSDQESDQNSSATLYFKKLDPTRYDISIKNFAGTADLAFLENFHQGWKLYLGSSDDLANCGQTVQFINYRAVECKNGSRVNKWGESFTDFLDKPWFDSTHGKQFDYANKWTLDQKTILDLGKAQSAIPNFQKKNAVTKNPDGSIDVNLTLYFRPQTPFRFSVLISLLAVVLSAIYVLANKNGIHEDKKIK